MRVLLQRNSAQRGASGLRHACWLLVALLCSGVSSCASLPDVRELGSTLTPSATPTVSGAHGPLSDSRTLTLLRKRWPKGTLDLQAAAALEEAATGVPLIAGNKCTLLYDGPQTMAAMAAAIAAATDHINLETYIFEQDALGRQFADLLIERQRQGITVNILYDSVGTLEVPQAFFERMRAAGIHLVAFNPVNPARLRGDDWRINNRDHRKLLVVDGKVAFTGGLNISGTYARGSLFRSRSQPADAAHLGWRDTEVMVEGPAVAAFQWLFMRTWASQDADDLRDAHYFPTPVAAGDKIVRVLASEPGGHYEIYRAYSLAIQQARHSIHLTSAYFVPDRQTVAALAAAARRGVDVRLVVPGQSDQGLVFYAGRASYDALLDAGVHIHAMKPAILHAKTAVIDGEWSTVGSTNIDTRSFLHNSELNVVVLGDGFGKEMESAFQEDLRDSVEITPQAWHARPLGERLREWLARIMAYWL
ncbi:cardiolipin synthase [Rugamonas apoptosis]|uniref:Cardiolipin synthase n=1 Tax=Rugamonas apoptosis TaxID=2758570 RepID=A0A7W2F7W6_9BURK|nr:cardiolipin synthase [Rugamonas apoptosis]MBA5686735.1 cardiolipin synthase [Rugamonas apoptosis]